MQSAGSYFLYTALAYPFMGLFSSCEAIFHSMGSPRVSMIASAVMNIVNISANAVFIFGLDWGVSGAALGTLLARASGAAVLVVLLHNRKNALYVESLLRIRPDFSLIRSICHIGIPNGLENSMFQLGRVMTQSLIATFGTAQIAANAAALSITSLQYIPGSAIGTAMIIIVGRCVGAQEKEQAKKYTLRLLAIAYSAIITLSTVIVLFRSPIVATYNLTGDSFDLAVRLLLYHTVCVCTVWPLAFTLPNSFRAASDVKFTMTLSIFSMWVFRIGLSYFFSDQFHWGIMSVWYAMAVDWTFRAIVFTIHYCRGKWLTKYHGV
jgi:putative MATE family efflux protein